jgi:hypothetical protein
VVINILEVHIASIFGTSASKTFVPMYQTETWSHNLEDSNMNSHCMRTTYLRENECVYKYTAGKNIYTKEEEAKRRMEEAAL